MVIDRLWCERVTTQKAEVWLTDNQHRPRLQPLKCVLYCLGMCIPYTAVLDSRSASSHTPTPLPHPSPSPSSLIWYRLVLGEYPHLSENVRGVIIFKACMASQKCDLSVLMGCTYTVCSVHLQRNAELTVLYDVLLEPATQLVLHADGYVVTSLRNMCLCAVPNVCVSCAVPNVCVSCCVAVWECVLGREVEK